MSRDIVARRIGEEQQPIVIVEDFSARPDTLRAAAASASFQPAARHYPGIRAAVPDDYLTAQRDVLAPVFAQVFGGQRTIKILDVSFSIVTTPPQDLVPEQCLPHFDALEPGRLALVHYLALDGGDGTAFFRHRATGYETIDAERAPRYFSTLNAERLPDASAAPAYPCGSTETFERIAHVEGRYNRAVLYRSAILHSGAIAAGSILDPDPTRGRLTITAFFDAG